MCLGAVMPTFTLPVPTLSMVISISLPITRLSPFFREKTNIRVVQIVASLWPYTLSTALSLPLASLKKVPRVGHILDLVRRRYPSTGDQHLRALNSGCFTEY